MLLNDNMYIENYVESFKRKFKNFCNKSPIYIRYIIDYDEYPFLIKVNIPDINKYNTFMLDTNKDVKVLIHEIKLWLLQFYPTFMNVEQRYTRLANGKLLKNPDIVFRVERIILSLDRLIIRNLNNNKAYMYQFNMPVSSFVKNILNKNWDNDKVYKTFIERSSIMDNKNVS
jgi:hypothetical protein